MIYLIKAENNNIEVLGDTETLIAFLTTNEEKIEKSNNELLEIALSRVDKTISEEVWEKSHFSAYIKNNEIILGPDINGLFELLRYFRKEKLEEYDIIVQQLQRNLRFADEFTKSEITNELDKWDTYAQSLCDLPEQPGAPWDGGGPETPWPAKPDSE